MPTAIIKWVPLCFLLWVGTAGAADYKYNFTTESGGETCTGFTNDFGYPVSLSGKWTQDKRTDVRDRDTNGDECKDSLIFQTNVGGATATWNLTVANDTYSVTTISGDAQNAQVSRIDVEGITVISASTSTNTFATDTRDITVSDGTLTVVIGAHVGGTGTSVLNSIAAIGSGAAPLRRRRPMIFSSLFDFFVWMHPDRRLKDAYAHLH